MSDDTRPGLDALIDELRRASEYCDPGWFRNLFQSAAAALAAERERAERAEARIAEAVDALPREPYYTHDIGPAYTVEGVDEAFEILTAAEATP